MNQDHSFSTNQTNNNVQINLDEFDISEDSFKPMTKGLGFHQEQKRASFKPAPKEVKPFGSAKKEMKTSALLNPLTQNAAAVAKNHMPTGLEAFYGTKGTSVLQDQTQEKKIDLQITETVKPQLKTASAPTQFIAWMIDIALIAAFVAVTGALLILASGIQYQILINLISQQDLIIFASAVFSIYYVLYFTILDLTSSPGKTIMGIRLVKADNTAATVKHTFTRSLISLLSSVALFLPLVLDFQGRLSDTKVVK